MKKNSPTFILLIFFVLLLVSVLPVIATTDSTSDSAALLSSELASNRHEDQGVKFSSDPIIFSSSLSKTTSIDFENLPEWTVITDQYKNLGVIFSGETQILTDGGSLNIAGYPPRSGKNVAFSYTRGIIQANFTNPVSNVGFYYWSKYDLYLDAYDAEGTLIETKTGIPDTEGSTHGPIMYNLNINNKPGISSIVIRSPANYFVIDDFSFTPSTSSAGIKIISPSNGDNFYISATSKMPTINFKAQVTGVNPDPTSTTSFSWNGVLSDTWIDRDVSTGKTFSTSKTFPVHANIVGGEWKPKFANVMGGDLNVTVKATVNGKQYRDNVTVHILGTNPKKQAVQEKLGDLKYQVIAYHESIKWRQFNVVTKPVGTPVFGQPAGYGIMQLDPVPSYKERWDWTANVNAGIRHFNINLAAAEGLSAKVKNYYKGKQSVTDLTSDQILRQAYYAYNAGDPSANGMKNTYYTWDTKKHIWTLNTKANKNGRVYADKLMDTYNNVKNGNLPSNW